MSSVKIAMTKEQLHPLHSFAIHPVRDGKTVSGRVTPIAELVSAMVTEQTDLPP